VVSVVGTVLDGVVILVVVGSSVEDDTSVVAIIVFDVDAKE
jgi:hypothetical protein